MTADLRTDKYTLYLGTDKRPPITNMNILLTVMLMLIETPTLGMNMLNTRESLDLWGSVSRSGLNTSRSTGNILPIS